MRRDLQDFLDEPPFGLIIAGALGLIVTVFAFVGFRNLRSDDQVDTSAQTTTSVAESTLVAPAAPTALIFTPSSSEGVTCNGLKQTAGVVSGADPGESLLFNGAPATDLAPGVADATGSYPVEWSCAADQVGTTWRIQAVGQKSGGRVDMVFTGSSESSGSGFRSTSVTDPFPCDGEVHPVAVLVGAEGGEEITFSSPQSSSIRPGTADANGQLQMNWSCNPSQANTTWNVTATGSNSNQIAEIIFSGSAVAGTEKPTTTTSTAKQTTSEATTATTTASTTSVASTSATASPAELIVQVSEDPFGCDGTSRQFATIKNFAPLEVVTFAVSPANDPLRQGKADDDGQLLVRWKCDAADAGTEWNLTATGATSAKTVSFSFAGKAAGSTSGGTGSGGDAGSDSGGDSGSDPDPSTQLSVAVIENPFICDGDARPVATLSNLGSQEVVTFSSSDGTSYRNGRATTSGDLTVRWQCDEGESKTWNLTATGQTTGRTVDFSILGSSAASDG